MKDFNFNNYLAEGWMHKTIEEAEDSNAPKVGTKATDWAGEEVTIVDVLKLPAKQRDLDWFLNQYDSSGIMRDCYRDPEGYDFDPDEYDYYVAVEHPELSGTVVYVWGPDGVCYDSDNNDAPKEDVEEGCHNVDELKREPKQATKSDLKGFASKSATLDRAKRVEKGNWKNSVGEFVEKHSAEIGEVSPFGKAAIVNYIETRMKPSLSDEAKEKVDELVNSSRSASDLLYALYNTMLKGAGMGLHEDQEEHGDYDDETVDIGDRDSQVITVSTIKDPDPGKGWYPFNPDTDAFYFEDVLPKGKIDQIKSWSVDADTVSYEMEMQAGEKIVDESAFYKFLASCKSFDDYQDRFSEESDKFLGECDDEDISDENLEETTLDYDMDNFSGKWSRGPRYDILVDGEVYYSDIPEESVDRLCSDLSQREYENIQVVEL